MNCIYFHNLSFIAKKKTVAEKISAENIRIRVLIKFIKYATFMLYVFINTNVKLIVVGYHHNNFVIVL